MSACLWLMALLATPPVVPLDLPSEQEVVGRVKTTKRLAALGPLRVGAEAPWFSGWSLDGEVLNPKKLPADRPWAFVFFATWCRPCITGLELLQAGRAELEAAGLHVVLVNHAEEEPAVRAFLKERSLWGQFPVLHDKFGEMAKSFGVSQGEKLVLPRTIVLSPDRQVLAIFGEEGADYIPALTASLKDSR